MLIPLRDLFGAVFFVAIGLTVVPADLIPAYAARSHRARRGDRALHQSLHRRVATAWLGPGSYERVPHSSARGEFSLVIIRSGRNHRRVVGAIATPYVFVLASLGPLLARFAK